jgi:LAGLIDADG DNA endonuclease family
MDWLTPEGLACWYADDGSLKWKNRSNAVRFCTDSFTLEEVQLLQQILRLKFSLPSAIHKQGRFYRLYISENCYAQLRELILPHLHPSMYYKFPDGNRGTMGTSE